MNRYRAAAGAVYSGVDMDWAKLVAQLTAATQISDAPKDVESIHTALGILTFVLNRAIAPTQRRVAQSRVPAASQPRRSR